MHMRKADREVKDKHEIIKILNSCSVCRVAFCVENKPYIVPMNFGYAYEDKLVLYFHCAGEGRKIDMLNANNFVCFEMDEELGLIPGDKACKYSMNYQSIIGDGRISFVSEKDSKLEGLELIMEHYGGGGLPFDEKILERTTVLKLEAESFAAKRLMKG